MLISFDIDNTLICSDKTVPCEPNRVPWWRRYWYNESLRAGTVQLMTELQATGWQLAIYTTSLRSPAYLQRLFKFYGISLTKVINQEIHDQTLKSSTSGKIPSKWPTKFQIDLHVDDAPGVLIEGQQFNFNVIIVKPTDRDWVELVLAASSKLKQNLTTI